MSNLRWTWIEPEGRAQPETFESAEAAIDDMIARQGWHGVYRVEAVARIHRVGFKLALVEVKLSVLLVLDAPATKPA